MRPRLDQLLVTQGLAQSRERAKALVMAGQVYVNGQKADKAGEMVSESASIELRGGDLPYVSRGGLKLEKALAVFGVVVEGKVCMDIGASTGGFTDCLLQNGAAKVYAVDVGYGQLAWKLRTDHRVVNWERTNIRHVTAEQVSEPIALFVADVSFISLKHLFPVMAALAAHNATAVTLVKPQFEAGRDKVGKKGVVREAAVHKEVLEKVLNLGKENGLVPLAIDFSPVQGPEGNIEFIAHWAVNNETAEEQVNGNIIARTVDAAHQHFDAKTNGQQTPAEEGAK